MIFWHDFLKKKHIATKEDFAKKRSMKKNPGSPMIVFNKDKRVKM